MTAVLYLLLLFLQQCNSEETLLAPNNKTLQVNITTSEETLLTNITNEETSLVNITTCEKLADMCTYTLPRILEKEREYDQCQVTCHVRGKFTLSIFAKFSHPSLSRMKECGRMETSLLQIVWSLFSLEPSPTSSTWFPLHTFILRK